MITAAVSNTVRTKYEPRSSTRRSQPTTGHFRLFLRHAFTSRLCASGGRHHVPSRATTERDMSKNDAVCVTWLWRCRERRNGWCVDDGHGTGVSVVILVPGPPPGQAQMNSTPTERVHHMLALISNLLYVYAH